MSARAKPRAAWILFLPILLAYALAFIGIIDPSYVGISIIIGIVVLIAALVAIGIAYSRWRVEQFRRYARVEGDRLVFPEEVVVELGDVVLKQYWVEAARGPRGRGSSPWFTGERSVQNPEVVRVRAVDLSRVCAKPFFVFAERSGVAIIDAPGLRVGSGRFNDMIVVCLDRSSVPERVVELEAGDPTEHRRARVRVGPRGIDAEVSWVFKAPVQRRVVYDRERGVYGVVEEYTTKPRAKGVRVELCVQTPSRRYCATLARAEEPNKPVRASLPVDVRERLLHLSDVGYALIRRAVGSGSELVVAGYKPGYMTARVVLEIPRSRDIESEAPL